MVQKPRVPQGQRELKGDAEGPTTISGTHQAASSIAAQGYGRGATRGVVPSTHTGLPWEVMLTLELVNPGDVASMTDVPA